MPYPLHYSKAEKKAMKRKGKKGSIASGKGK